jgi:NDP-sugar pyrophosphorylase family protein
MKTAVVLAAGRGTRMGELTSSMPKPLLEVAGRSLIEHVVGGIAAAGVERIVVVTGYLAARIEAALGDGARFGTEIRCVRQERTDGTARALLLAEAELADAPFLLSWSDVLVAPSVYAEVAREFATSSSDAVLAVNEVDDPWRGAAVYVDADWRVTKLEEKPARGTATTRWNNAGILACAPVVLDYARRLVPSPRGEYELPQAIASMVRDGRAVRARPVRGFWCDVGTPHDLERADRELRRAGGAP